MIGRYIENILNNTLKLKIKLNHKQLMGILKICLTLIELILMNLPI